ncbi:TetR/AcrR family transcriptional regulator [Virgisporangium aurantiacum]|uniref:TetR family transcriptional regulator n=1 Tax=Virgisporangium aurantiacum TaxID=175570 RepID=A0A8J3Z708_9ACTN|nr:TetR/AcrR family transcriptional regulator [Virgisporangium aurantiacum]GIJ58589.1 TetR family transcriptional regulator [Virgisporangium aurantiacum]
MAGRRPRADAVRNYERLLEHAEVAFREQGTGASLEGIARQAGVAIGTLYGHFPNRRALLGAVLRQRHLELFAFGDGLLADAGAAEALTEWTRAVARHAAAYTGLADVIAGAAGIDDETSELHAACARLDAITEAVVARARRLGKVRPDATAADLTAVMGAAAWLRGQASPEQADRLIEVTLDGLCRPPL